MYFELLNRRSKQNIKVKWNLNLTVFVCSFSGKMKKIYIYVAGNTLDSHKAFLKKLTNKGAKEVNSPDKSDATIVFCPIVSRFETDIKSALSSASGKHAETKMHMKMSYHVLSFSCKLWSVFSVCVKALGCEKIILVAMHHTFEKDYTLPNHREPDNRAVLLLVDCLFFENRGLLSCSRNKNAVNMVCNQVIAQQVKHPFYMV